jgi:hypothetical protein
MKVFARRLGGRWRGCVAPDRLIDAFNRRIQPTHPTA